MFTVYVNKYKPIPGDSRFGNGDVETELFSIPNQNGEDRLFLNAVISEEMGNAGNFEFSIDPKNKLYDIWKHMRTLVRVEYDGTTIFYGRVLTIDRDMFRTRKIHCEGTMTFFKDSLFEGAKRGTTETLNSYLTRLINAHNACMTSAPEKKIFLGEVPGAYTSATDEIQQIKNDTQKFGEGTGYKSVKEWLEGLASDYGGFFRTRYENGQVYLDWMKMYFQKTESNQTLSVTSNVVDLSDTIEVNNIFTHVVAVGKNGKYIDGTSSGGGGGGGGTSPDQGKYAITRKITGDGTGTISRTRANEGMTITMTATPDEGAEFRYYSINSNGRVTNITSNSFTMPNNDVTVTIAFSNANKPDDEGIPVVDPDTPVAGQYTISKRISGNGNGTISRSKANEGDTITMTNTPGEGSTFRYYSINSNGQVTNVTNNSFIMPANDVTVTITFTNVLPQ